MLKQRAKYSKTIAKTKQSPRASQNLKLAVEKSGRTAGRNLDQHENTEKVKHAEVGFKESSVFKILRS